MHFDEQSLRDLLSSVYGQTCGQSILDRVEAGNIVAITLSDGSRLELSERQAAAETLMRLFNWKLVE